MKIVAYLLVIILPIAIILTNFWYLTFNFGFYQSLYQKTGVYKAFGGQKQVDYETANLLGYYRGKNTLDHNFFSNQAVLHLGDVKQLLQFSTDFLYLAGLVSLVILVLLVYKKRYKLIFSSLIYSSLATIVFMVILALGIANFFDPLFIKFHQALFANSLWLFPADDNLIKLFPQQFFVEFANRLALNIIITSALIAAGSWIINKSLIINHYS